MKPLPLLMLALAAVSASARADESLGQRLAQNSCAQCHSFAQGEGHGVGPNLFGIFGRPAASVSGFAFSKPYADSMKGKIWDRVLLDRWLTDTQAVAPGNGMVYFQDDPKKRDEIIKFLQSLN
jgi:cytochrome c